MIKNTDNLSEMLSVVLTVLVGILMTVVLLWVTFAENIHQEEVRSGGEPVRLEEIQQEEVASAASPIGVDVVYSFPVPADLSYDTYLAFNAAHQYVHIDLGGEQVYALEPSGRLGMLNTIGNNWVMLPLCQDDAGKEVRVVITPAYKFAKAWMPEFLMGAPLTIYGACLLQDLPQLAISFLMILTGLGFGGVAVYGMFTTKRGSVGMLGLFTAMLGLWYFSDATFVYIMFREKPVLQHYLSITMLMGCMFPLMRSMRDRYSEPSRNVLDMCCVAEGIVIVMELVMQILGIADLREMMPVTWGILILVMLAILGVMAYERISYPERYREYLFDKLVWVLAGGAAVVLLMTCIFGVGAGLAILMLAALCYIVVRGLDILFSRSEQEDALQKLLAEKENQLMQSRLTTMQSQIRSHFIFNILNAISGMCKYDPEKADQTVVCFARYLRTNIDIMQDEQKVTFRSALRHLEDYVALEQIRFGDHIRFVTQIYVENFMIPPLVLQPIVENAIKHGLTPKSNGGTVRLRTWTVNDEVWIEIRDDGVGFNVDAVSSERSVGLKNVRFRLEQLMHGRMMINSTPGKGTVVTIVIPREETDQ